MTQTFEGIVVDGGIRLHGNVELPENTRVFVVVPDAAPTAKSPRIHSPRLAHPERAKDFEMEVLLDEAHDASV
jgi:hypothetical protein